MEMKKFQIYLKLPEWGDKEERKSSVRDMRRKEWEDGLISGQSLEKSVVSQQ